VPKSILHFEKYDSDPLRPWVVFVHGAGGSTRTWYKQIDAFLENYNVLLLDLRDHGQSKNLEWDHDQYNFELISNDIRATMDEAKVSQAHFVSLSFGSVLLQDFYRRYPERVLSMTMAGGIFHANFWIRAFVHYARFMNRFLHYEQMYRFFSYLLMPFPRNQKARKVYEKQAEKINQDEYLRWLALYDAFFQLLQDFHAQEMHCPTLIVMGKDDYIFLGSARRFFRTQKNARMIEFDRVGHICNIEAPGPFNEAVLSFLDEFREVHAVPA
jgi:pimeloyl-ACP methyl ester carboxylesterase